MTIVRVNPPRRVTPNVQPPNNKAAKHTQNPHRTEREREKCTIIVGDFNIFLSTTDQTAEIGRDTQEFTTTTNQQALTDISRTLPKQQNTQSVQMPTEHMRTQITCWASANLSKFKRNENIQSVFCGCSGLKPEVNNNDLKLLATKQRIPNHHGVSLR